MKCQRGFFGDGVESSRFDGQFRGKISGKRLKLGLTTMFNSMFKLFGFYFPLV